MPILYSFTTVVCNLFWIIISFANCCVFYWLNLLLPLIEEIIKFNLFIFINDMESKILDNSGDQGRRGRVQDLKVQKFAIVGHCCWFGIEFDLKIQKH